MNPVHKELKEIRIKKGVSLEHISAVTKIRVYILENLEKGDFSKAPNPYIRAFLREYAEVVGINPDRVIAKFESKITTILEEPLSGDESSPTPGTPVTKGKISKKKKGKDPRKSTRSAKKTSESNDKSPAVLPSESLQDFSEHVAGKIKCSGIRQPGKGTSKVNSNEIAHPSATSNQLEDSEPSKD